MTKDARSKYVRKWIRHAGESSDPYDIFLSFWIAMTIAVQIHRTGGKAYHKEEDTNRDKILDYFRMNKKKIVDVMTKNEETMTRLARLRGPKYKDPIIDTGNPELREMFSELVRYYSGKKFRCSQTRMAENLAELVSKARYNLFRTRMAHDIDYDKTLLTILNVIIADILRSCEGV